MPHDVRRENATATGRAKRREPGIHNPCISLAIRTGLWIADRRFAASVKTSESFSAAC
jgi:hypothetical protein